MAPAIERHKGSPVYCAADARRIARQRLPRLVFDFIEGAAGREIAAGRNTKALDAVALQPRVLQDVSKRSSGVSLLGSGFALPFGIAPMGMCNLIWPEADRMLARAARAFDIPVCLSTAASSTIEEMAQWAGPNAWFQLYVSHSPEVALSLAERAEKAGYDKLILTVDVPQVSRRVRDLRNGFTMPFQIGPRQFTDFARHPRWALATLRHGAPAPRNFPQDDDALRFDRKASRAGAHWQFLDRLRNVWKGKLIVKGVTSAADARRIRKAGADAVWVSNHGGRQLDSAPAAISLLPAIRAAVGPDYPLIFDSGIRSGEDILRAMAMGADFAMLGRPVLFSIGADGERGLNSMLAIMAEEIDIALAQIGLSDINGISPRNLADGEQRPPDDDTAALRVTRAN